MKRVEPDMTHNYPINSKKKKKKKTKKKKKKEGELQIMQLLTNSSNKKYKKLDPSPRLSTRAMNKTGHSDDNSSGQTSTQRTEPMMASTSGAGGPTSSRGPMAE